MNKVMLIGNLTRDPELTQTSSGINICRFAIAVTRRFANQDGERETDFFNITAWRQLGELCHKYLKKGNKVCIVGSIQIRQYEGNDGVKRSSVDIIADDVEFLTPKNSSGAIDYDDDIPPAEKTSSSKKKAKSISDLEPVEDDGELPF